jgi:hypothetical protein
MKPFNLLQALEGKPVITRNGELVTEIIQFANISSPYCIAGICNGTIYTWSIDGQIDVISDLEHKKDLFMAEESKTIWINVWKHVKDGSLSASVHSRKDKCDMEIDELLSHTLIKTIEITE